MKARSKLYDVPASEIHIEEGFNVREETPELEKHIDELAQSIAAAGIRQPLKVYEKNFDNGSKFVVIDGHCRYKAFKKAQEEYELSEDALIPVFTADKAEDDADRILAMVLNNSGKNLSPIELSEVVKRVTAIGLSNNDIAKRIGVSNSRITQLLQLAGSPVAIKNMIREGKVSSTLALEVLQNSNNEEEAVSKLQESIEVASEQGKEKATKKHLGKKGGAAKNKGNTQKITPLNRIKSLQSLISINKEEIVDDADGGTVMIPRDMWIELSSLIGELQDKKSSKKKMAEAEIDTSEVANDSGDNDSDINYLEEASG